MTANPHLAPQLDAYLGQNEPGFAIMIDALWGAGKTHAVKAWLTGRQYCYVSLFGVPSIEAIEEALFNQLLEDRDIKIPQSVTQFLEGVTEKFTGATINLTGFHRQQVLKNLPKLLIFDDLERARMKAPALLAALNRFVEHEGRHVILIANEAELGKSDDYCKWREKVVGRTVTLSPETGPALDACLGLLEAGAAKDFLTERRDLIVAVFNGSATCNLRLLRQSVTEFAALHALLPDDIRIKTSGMRFLFATFLALSIAYHAGQITKDDLLQRRQSTPKVSHDANGEAPLPTPLQALHDRFKGQSSVLFHGHVLPPALARQLIGDGYAPTDVIANALRDLAIFHDEADQHWVTLWKWRSRDEDEVTTALGHVQAQLDRKEITFPTIILHLWGIFTGFAKHGIVNDSEDAVTQKIKDYIAALETDGKLPDDYPRARWKYDLLQQSSHGLGYAYLETPEFADIRDNLIAALDRVYRSGDAKRVEQLLRLLRSDVEGFVQAITGTRYQEDLPDFSQEPVFANADPKQVAEIMCSLPPEAMHKALRPFNDRLNYLAANAHRVPDPGAAAPPEHPERIFLKAMRAEANSIAKGSSPIRAAQIKNSLDWYLGFLDPAEVASSPNP